MYYTKNARVLHVGEGFNWFAFVFVWGWLLSRGLWKQGLIVMLLYIPIFFISSSVNLTFMDGIKQDEVFYLVPMLIILIIHIFVGKKGNQWRETLLQERGYKKA